MYNGVDPEVFSPGSEPSPDGPIVLCVGNLLPIKGHEVLIRAVASIVSEFPALTLEIIGHGPELSRLQALAQQTSDCWKSVRFLGRQSRQQVARPCSRDAVCLPSRYEGLGCVYLEAMSCGKPVIGCRGQGIAEIIQQGSNGFLVDPNNEEELAVTLRTLFREPAQRSDLGQIARDCILNGLTLEQQAEKLVRIYRESCNETARCG